MRVIREFIARLFVILAIAAGLTALGTWWGSYLVVKNAAALDRVAALKAASQVTSQLKSHSSGIPINPEIDKAILKSFTSTRVLDEFALSAQRGVAAFRADLAKIDPRLNKALGNKPLKVTVSTVNVVAIAANLRKVARIALEVGIGTAAVALLLAPLRHLVLRRIGIAATVVCGLAAALTWGIPNLVAAHAHGSVHHAAVTVLSDGAPVRLVVRDCLIGGAIAYLVTRTFELLGGRRRVVYQRSAGPLARSKAA